MVLNFFIKSLLLSILIAVVSAYDSNLTGDCKDIFDFFDIRNNTNSLSGCVVDGNGKVTALVLKSYEITEECVKKALSYNTITKLTYEKIGTTPSHDPVYKLFPPEIANLTSLEEFAFSFSGYRPYATTSIADGALKLSKSLKRLFISGIVATQSNIDDISTLTNLEQLDLSYFNRPAEKFNVDSLKSLTKLSYLELKNQGYVSFETMPEVVYSSANTLNHLTITGHGIGGITDEFSKLENLKYLDLRGCELSNILDYVKDLKKLEYLDVSLNNINTELPEALNDLENLKYIDLSENINITGKTLVLSNLETCVYDKKYDLCKPEKDIKCLQDNRYGFSECDDEPLGFSTDGQCGIGHGRCPNGYCCSRFGWCGNTPLHCSVSEGCQDKLGDCNGTPTPSPSPTTIDTISTTSSSTPTDNGLGYTETGKCGPNDGKCRPGHCCSKYGWCGTGKAYCDAGCQNEFGNCN